MADTQPVDHLVIDRARTDAAMEVLARAHLTHTGLADDMAETLRPFILAEARDAIVGELDGFATTHPRHKSVGTHWADCWKSHPECAIQMCIETVKRHTGATDRQ